MQKRRTQYFHITLGASGAFSALFLAVIAIFGRTLASTNFNGITDCVFAVMALAAGSFLVFSFLPYFQGDRRWYSISALLTVVFFLSAVLLWQVSPIGTVIA